MKNNIFFVSLCLCVYFFFLLALSHSSAAQFDGCMLAIDPSTGSWISREDSAGRATLRYAPGSAIKPFTVIAAIESGARTDMVVHCAPSDPKTAVRDSCWYRPGHGAVDLQKAIAFSCDNYFRNFSRGIKWAAFLNVLIRFGLVEKSDMATLDALGTDERLDAMTGLSVKIKVSPIILLCAYSAIFNGGYLFENGSGGKLKIRRRIEIDNKATDILAAGMLGATRFGTAFEIGKAFPGVEILSKTGTAIFSEGGAVDHSRTHGWYVGISPEKTPRYAIVIFIPEGTGAHDAVPAAIRFWPEILGHANP